MGPRLGRQTHPMIQDPRARAFEALAHLLVSEDSLATALTAVLRTVAETIPAAKHAGLTTGDAHGKAATPIFTDPEVPQMDEAQYSSGRGPCLDAWRTGEVVRLDGLTKASMYPEFASAAMGCGILSTLSMPLVAGGNSVGALNLYRPVLQGLSADDEQLVADLAPGTAAFITNAQAYWHAFDLTEQLNQSMTSRSVIDQAIGMLMSRDPDLDPDGAFDMLRTASQRENLKLREIARRIVERRTPPES